MKNSIKIILHIFLLLILIFSTISCGEDRDEKFNSLYYYTNIEKVDNTIYFYNSENGYLKAIDITTDDSEQFFVGKNLDTLKKINYKLSDTTKESYLILNGKEKELFVIDGLKMKKVELPYEYNSIVSNPELSIVTLRNVNNSDDVPISYSPNNFGFLDLSKDNLDVKSHTISAGGGTPVNLYFSKLLKFKVNGTIKEKNLMLVEYNTKAIILDIAEPSNFKVIPLVLENSTKTLSFKKVIFENNLRDRDEIDSTESLYILASGSKDLYNISLSLNNEYKLNISISESDIQEYASDIIYLVNDDKNGIILSYSVNSDNIYITDTISDKKMELSINNRVKKIQRISDKKVIVIGNKSTNNISKIDIIDIDNIFKNRSKNIKTVKFTIPIDKVTFLENQNYLLIESFLGVKTIFSFLDLDSFKIFDHHIAIADVKTTFSKNKEKLYLYGEKDKTYFIYVDLKEISEETLNFKLYEYDFSISNLLVVNDKIVVINSQFFNQYYGFFDLVTIDDELNIENFNHFMIEGL